jgi:membrane protease YdiL (CAAX protease family)
VTDPLAAARAVVWNAEAGRPRAPVRLAGHAGLLVAASVVLAVLLVAAGGRAVLSPDGPLGTLAVNVALAGGGAVVATLVAARLLDRRPLSGLGLGLDRAWGRDLAAGLALGVALQAGVFVTSLAAGWTTVEGVGGPDVAGALLAGAALMAWVGLYEELLFRGYYLVNLAEGLLALPRVDARRGLLAAAALTALAFGGVHAANPGATALSTVLVAVYGISLAAGYLLTGDLALPVGFHAAWNYAQAFVFGFPVSGFAVEGSLLETATTGPPALTGGAFGPEAGVVGLAWVAASLPAGCWWVRRTRGGVALQVGVGRAPPASSPEDERAPAES